MKTEPARSVPPAWPFGSIHDWESLRAELLFIFDQEIPADRLTLRGTRGGDFSAWLVRKGRASIVADGKRSEAGPGQWLICFAQTIEQSFEPGTRLLSLRILQDWPDGSLLFSGPAVHVFDAGRYPQLERLARPLLQFAGNLPLEQPARDPREEFLWKTRITYRAFARYRSRLTGWLAALAEALTQEGFRMNVPTTTDPRLTRMFQVLDANPPGNPFPEREMVRAGELSIGSLNRLCLRTCGFTPYSYWERRRVQRARQALEISGMQVKAVAFQLGFRQLSHFSAWFKRHVGASPRAYRQSLFGKG